MRPVAEFGYWVRQGVTKRCRLSWLTNGALVMSPNEGGGVGGLPMSTAEHMEPNKLWRSSSIFNLWGEASLR